MEIEIARTSWTTLKALRSQIRAGARTGDVKEMEKLLLKGIARAISAELKRIDMFEEDIYGYDPVVTVDVRIKKGWRSERERPKKSLIAELDAILSAKPPKNLVEF